MYCSEKPTATFVSRQIGDRLAGKGATKRHQNPPWKAPVVHSIDYKSVLKRNSYTVTTRDGNYYQVKYYIKSYLRCTNAIFCKQSAHCACRIPHYLSVCYLLEKAKMQLSSDAITHASAAHIVPVMHESKVTVAIRVGMISSVCVFVSYGEDVDFVCKVPNR